MTGTAATMGIEENLALAKRRGKSRLLRPGITRQEREEYHELLKILGLGLEDHFQSRTPLRWPASGIDTSDGNFKEASASSSG